MAGQRASGPFFRSLQRASSSTTCGRCLKLQRTLASQAGAATSRPPDEDLINSSSLGIPPLPEDAHTFDPLKSSRGRKRQLPPSRSVRSSPFPLPIGGLTCLQISIPTSEVRPWPTSPAPSSASLRSIFSNVRSWSFLLSAPGSNLSQYNRPRHYDSMLPTQPAWLPASIKGTAPARLGRGVAIP
jgi:hypothetical protein